MSTSATHPSTERLYTAAAQAPFFDTEPAKIAKRLNTSVQVVQNWKKRGISKEGALEIQRIYGFDPRWILGADGGDGRAPARRVERNGTAVEQLPTNVSASATRSGYVRLERLAIEVSAGGGTAVGNESEVVEMLDVADWWAQQNLPRDLSKVRVVTARGDSMAPDIQHGDVLFVDISQPRFEAPGLYVMNWQGRALVKRLVPEIARGRLAIVSNNPAYPPEHIDEGEIDSLKIAGRVAAWWTLRKF